MNLLQEKMSQPIPAPDDMLMHLFSMHALEMDADKDWQRARTLLGALFRKYGPFQVEVAKKGIWVPTSHV